MIEMKQPKTKKKKVRKKEKRVTSVYVCNPIIIDRLYNLQL